MKFSFVKRGGVWVLVQGALLLAVFVSALTWRSTDWSPAVCFLGAVLLAVSAVVGVSGALALGKNLTPFPKPKSNAQLVRSGIYRRIRHPLYTSVALAGLGWALVCQSWPALVIALGLGGFLDAKARREESWLREQFPQYADYARTTCRFIPGLY